MPYGIDWADESYVRVYTADSLSWRALGWTAQAVYLALKRRLDRVGRLQCAGLPPEAAVAAVTAAPPEVAAEGLRVLIDQGWIVYSAGADCLIDPDHIESESASRTGRARCREHRERVRDRALAQQAEPAKAKVEKKPTADKAEKKRKSTPRQPGAFDSWWALWPRKHSKKQAKTAYEKASSGKDWPGHEAVMAATRQQVRCNGWDGGKFTPHGATWLNQGRYLDDPSEIEASAQGPKDTKRQVSARSTAEDIENRRARRMSSDDGNAALRSLLGRVGQRPPDENRQALLVPGSTDVRGGHAESSG